MSFADTYPLDASPKAVAECLISRFGTFGLLGVHIQIIWERLRACEETCEDIDFITNLDEYAKWYDVNSEALRKIQAQVRTLLARRKVRYQNGKMVPCVRGPRWPRKEKIWALYQQGETTRDIARECHMSFEQVQAVLTELGLPIN